MFYGFGIRTYRAFDVRVYSNFYRFIWNSWWKFISTVTVFRYIVIEFFLLRNIPSIKLNIIIEIVTVPNDINTYNDCILCK